MQAASLQLPVAVCLEGAHQTSRPATIIAMVPILLRSRKASRKTKGHGDQAAGGAPSGVNLAQDQARCSACAHIALTRLRSRCSGLSSWLRSCCSSRSITLPWPSLDSRELSCTPSTSFDASSPHTSSLGSAAGLAIGQAEVWRIKELRGHYPGAHAAHLSCHCHLKLAECGQETIQGTPHTCGRRWTAFRRVLYSKK